MQDFHGIIPAAGSGTRLGADLPKQFHSLGDHTIVDHAIAALLADARIKRVHVALAPDASPSWPQPGCSLGPKLRQRVITHRCGATTRAGTVLAATRIAIEQGANWVAVHDAVRPCLHIEDLAQLLDTVVTSKGPALLATPLAHTLKEVTDNRVTATVARAGKWLAQTPQVAPADALVAALVAHPDVTDEAQALELAGWQPAVVVANHLNIKITTKLDFDLATLLWARTGGA